MNPPPEEPVPPGGPSLILIGWGAILALGGLVVRGWDKRQQQQEDEIQKLRDRVHLLETENAAMGPMVREMWQDWKKEN